MACFAGEFATPSRRCLRHQGSKVKPTHRTYHDPLCFVKCLAMEAPDVTRVKALGFRKLLLENSFKFPAVHKTRSGNLSQYKDSFVACCCGLPCCQIADEIRRGNSRRSFDINAEEVRFDHYWKTVDNLYAPSVGRMAYEKGQNDDEDATNCHEATPAMNRVYWAPYFDPKLVNFQNETDKDLFCRRDAPDGHNIGFNLKGFDNSGGKRTFDVFSQNSSEEMGDLKRCKLSDSGHCFKTLDNNVDLIPCFAKCVGVDTGKNIGPRQQHVSKGTACPIPVAKTTDTCRLLQSRENNINASAQSVLHEIETDFSTETQRRYSELNAVPTHSSEGEESRHSASLHLHQVQSTPNTHLSQGTGESNAFICLDSTKSSFLNLVGQMRQQTNDVISCPYCNRKFGKYGDLKDHVQTHLNPSSTAGHCNKARTMCQPLPSPGHKSPTSDCSTLSTGVSSPGNRTPEGKPPREMTLGNKSPGEETKTKRATSVIMFVGQKAK